MEIDFKDKSIEYFLLPGWTALVLAFLSSILFSIPLEVQLVPLTLSVILLGLPHGAVDHLILPKALRESFSSRWAAYIALLYFLLGFLYLSAWFLTPLLSFVFFILITMYHWGRGELYHLEEVFNVELSKGSKWLAVLLRGSAPMLLPLVAFPDYYELFTEAVTSLFGVEGLSYLGIFFSQEIRLAILAAYIVGMAVYFADILRANAAGRLWDGAELVLLTVFFLFTPPIFAVGIYFCFWHSLRHIMRYIHLDNSVDCCTDIYGLLSSFRSFTRDSFPLTAVSIIFLGIFYFAVPFTPQSLLELVGLYMVLVSVFTLPHMVVVQKLDFIQTI